MSNTIFAEIRAACKSVTQNARWVRVHSERIPAYAAQLRAAPKSLMVHSAAHHLLGEGDRTVAFFLLLDAVNFGSGYFPFLDKDSGASGYFTIARRLSDWIRSSGLPSARRLRSIRGDAVADILGQSTANPHGDELTALFAAAWRELGAWIEKRWHGDYCGLPREAASAAEVVSWLGELSFFADVSQYVDQSVPFYKRAQIFVQDLSIADPEGYTSRYPDLDELTIFADNLLPYVLRADGILEYHPWLAERVDSGELIGAGSCEEVELRAAALHAVELLVQQEALHGTPARVLDYQLWNRGQSLKAIVPQPRHRTRTRFY
ncbi:MAG: queuosine salvage family protein [Lacisediminihabitans sp.]